MNRARKKEALPKCDVCKNYHDFELPDHILNELSTDRVVIFAGAGVSSESNLVFRDTVYEDIKTEMNIPNDTTVSFSRLTSKYCSQPNGRAKLLQAIQKRFNYMKSFPELYRII